MMPGEYLLEIGTAVRLYDIDDAPYKIRELLNDKGRMQQMAANAGKAAKPRAAFDIIRSVVEDLKPR